jgi:hypothetical protein
MSKRLRTIRKKALENYEERGIQTLFFTWGMVSWRPEDESRKSVPRAPLLLFPAELKASDAREDDHRIQLFGDPAVNPTLVHYLTSTFGVNTGRTRKGKVLLESELERLGIAYKNSRPYHPQTRGNVERFHQTLKRYLGKQPPAASLAELQLQLDSFRAYYNHHRPHRALDGQTPLMAFNARLKARPEAPVGTIT